MRLLFIFKKGVKSRCFYEQHVKKLSSRETGYSIHKENHTDFGRESWNFIKVNDVITSHFSIKKHKNVETIISLIKRNQKISSLEITFINFK